MYRDPINKLVLFDYRKGEEGKGRKSYIEKFKGYLQTDGYGVYDAFGWEEK
ncbi:MAG: transposase [Bacteroidetes bacterium]|nr:transposase [Bacteroidota bacterium]